ncbi:hypothetical protein BC938DRAFT_471090 [Jimgerdemannia flammicorona]|uniref:Uncharacterized protein n=1 Tax=Jimgerdemannia flammicorona TaxID=994334 RepID=A0A433R0A2_9FUNG|nr:hypothetical protein BC938DRAFT_471090 [Jimgerdemannia flammicorona]
MRTVVRTDTGDPREGVRIRAPTYGSISEQSGFFLQGRGDEVAVPKCLIFEKVMESEHQNMASFLNNLAALYHY